MAFTDAMVWAMLRHRSSRTCSPVSFRIGDYYCISVKKIVHINLMSLRHGLSRNPEGFAVHFYMAYDLRHDALLVLKGYDGFKRC